MGTLDTSGSTDTPPPSSESAPTREVIFIGGKYYLAEVYSDGSPPKLLPMSSGEALIKDLVPDKDYILATFEKRNDFEADMLVGNKKFVLPSHTKVRYITIG